MPIRRGVCVEARRIEVERLDVDTESRSLAASRARQTAAGKKKRGTPSGMTMVSFDEAKARDYL
jgi:hypothetical protein